MVTYLDDALVTDTQIKPVLNRSVTGYGPKISTPYLLRYAGRWHRVYMMLYGNSGSGYIRKGGQDLFLTADIEYQLEGLV